jgi:hypothetical protein
MKKAIFLNLLVLFFAIPKMSTAQDTQIKGFADFLTSYADKKVSFGFDEQDLFITSVISNKVSFLGESVFKFNPLSATDFSVSVERLIIYYNLKGNNNLVLGKVHTPINYWNDTYHHGRVFYPTIERPLLFSADIIPLHTVGVGLKGDDLGNIKFGYDLFIGNGLGSSNVLDNDQRKSITAAVHITPVDKLRLGISWYNDAVSKGANVEGKVMNWKVNQNLFTASVSSFGKKFEILAESTMGINHTDTTGSKKTLASYLYAGYKVKDKWIPYVRIDNLNYENGEIYYNKNNTTSVIAGLRYEINYLAVVKFEYQYQHSELMNNTNTVTAQFAVGF